MKNMKNMTIDSEKLVERTLVDLIKKEGGLCIKLSSQHFIGLPDRLCLMPNEQVAFVELKTTKQKPRKIQVYVHNKLRQLGFRVDVIDSVQGVKELVDEIKNLPF